MNRLIIILLVGALSLPLSTHAKRDKDKGNTEAQNRMSRASPDEAAFKTLLAEIQTGVRMVQAENMATGRGMGFPQKLDKQSDGPCVTCFADVTADGLNDPRWVKNGNTYRFSGADFSRAFTYDPASGTVKATP